MPHLSPKLLLLALVVVALAVGWGCHKVGGGGAADGGEGDTDTGADADTDADADSDADVCWEGHLQWENIGDCDSIPDDQVTESPVQSEQTAWLWPWELPCDEPDELECFQGDDSFIVVVSGDTGLAAVNQSITDYFPDYEPVEADFQSQRVIVFGGIIVVCGDYGQYGEDFGVEYDVFEWPDGRLHFETGIWAEPLNYFPDTEGLYLLIGAILVIDTDQNPTVCLS